MAILLERFITGLLDESQADALRGNLSGSVVRRIISRDLSETLEQWREDSGKILEVIGPEALP